MALFNADAILRDDQEDKDVILDFFDVPEGEKTPSITIELNNKTRGIYRRAADKYNNIRIKYRKGSKLPEGEIINDPVGFCQTILEKAYVGSLNLFDTPSKEAVLALLEKEPKFAKALASKLIDAFEHSELYQDEDDDEKN